MSRRRFASSSWILRVVCAAGVLGCASLRAQEPAEVEAGDVAPPNSDEPLEVAKPAKAAPPSLAAQIAEKVNAIVERSRGAICRIEAADDHGALRGTGFFVSADGTLLTSYSVGGESHDLVVTIGEQKFPATRRAADPRSGVAILKIEAGEPVPFLPMGNCAELDVSAPVVAVGFPLDLPLSPSFGLVAGFDLKFQGRYFAARHLRANLVVQRGQGGSPIFGMDGAVVGILISTVENNSGVFALPIEAAQKLLRDLERHGRLRQGWLGADVRLTDAPAFGSTARIRGLRPDGPGFRGGLRAGDVLLRVGERKIVNPEDVLDASFYITADESLMVEVARAGRVHEFSVTPTDPPDGKGPAAQRYSPPIIGANDAGLDLKADE